MNATGDARARPRLLTRSFARLLVAQACFGYAFSSFFMTPKFMVGALAGGPLEIGIATALYGVVVVVFMPLVGEAVDRVGRRDFLTAGALLMAATAFAFTQIDAIGPLLYTLRALQGLAFALAFVGGATLAVDQAPPERLGQAIGLFGLTFLAMNAVAPAVVEEVAQRADWPTAWTLSGCGAVACALLSRLLADHRARPADRSAAPGLFAFALRPRQLRTSAVIALAGAALGAVFNFHQPFALALGMTEVKDFFVAYASAAVCVRVALGQVADRIGRRRVALVCLLGYVAVMLGLTQLRPGTLGLFGAAMGAVHGLFYPAYNAVAAESVSEHERGKMMALFQAAWNVGFAVAQIALGALADRAGYPAVFLAAAVCAAAAFVVEIRSRDGAPTSPSAAPSAPSPRGSCAGR